MAVGLQIESGPRRGERVDVTGELVLGREGDVRFEDPQSSRRHVVVRTTSSGLEVEDLGSTNGTFVNDQQVSGRTPVSSGDVVRFGGTSMRVVGAPAAREPAVAPPPVHLERPVEAVFSPPAARRRPRVASRSPLATVLAIAVIVTTAIAVALYFAAR